LSSSFTGRAYKSLSIEQIKTLYYHFHQLLTGGWEQKIRMPPLCHASDADTRLFLQFDCSYSIPGDPVLSRMIGFGHPDLLFLLKSGPMNTFIDCTFRIVPKGFYQLMIIMVYSSAHETYVPVLYILLQNKKEHTYLRALTEAEFAANHHLRPKTVTCDFELALINAIVGKFPNVPLIGCLFHFKQAIRRKLVKDYKLPSDVVTTLCGENGHLNLLCSIDINDIIPHGIPYIRSKMTAEELVHREKLDKFWTYFVRTWMNTYDPNTWNVHSITTAHWTAQDILINRTNNPLERHNRTLNTNFPSAHPNMVNFVTTLRQEANNFATQLAHIQRGHQAPNQHQAPTIYAVPAEYLAFRQERIDANNASSAVAANNASTESGTAHHQSDDDSSVIFEQLTLSNVASHNNTTVGSTVQKRRRQQQPASVLTTLSPIFESSQENDKDLFPVCIDDSDTDVSVTSATSRSGRPLRRNTRYT
jgi:hypothetical protein